MKGPNVDEDVAIVRQLAEKFSGADLGILFQAIAAGMSQQQADFEQFVAMAFKPDAQPLKAEAIMVLIRLLIQSGNFEEARKFAADLHIMEHHVVHALARIRIARLTQDQEDNALAAEVVKEILDSHFRQQD